MGNGARIDLRRTREYTEVRAQPESWSQTMTLGDQFVPALCRLVEQAGTDAEIVFTGTGTSYHLALTAAGLFQEATGTAARAVPACDIVLAPATIFARGHRYTLVGLSRSGESSETLAALRRAAGDGHATAGLTTHGDSTLASAVSAPVVLPHAGDQAVAISRWGTNLLLAVQLWAAALAGKENWQQELVELPAAGDAGLDFWEEVAGDVAAGPPGKHYVFLGSGAYFGLALEGSRKMRQLAREPANAFHTLECRHGIATTVTPETVAILSSQRRYTRQEADVLADIARAGGRTLAVAEGAQALRAWLGIDMGSGLSDWARAPLHLLPLQLLALARAAACGSLPGGSPGTISAMRPDPLKGG